jgi:isochorismate hydrolase
MNYELPQSPQLLDPARSALLIVDFQTKLVPWIVAWERIEWNLQRLLEAAELFEVVVLATEQYPQGLGATWESVQSRLRAEPAEKVRFSCGACADLFHGLAHAGRDQIVVTGIETHVCVLQTTLDLLTAHFEIYLPVDAVGSRATLDHDIALDRMQWSGATLTTTESVLFEWCRQAGTPPFKRISQLVRQSPPASSTVRESGKYA